MTYTVEYTKTAVKQFKKLDRATAALLLAYIEKNLHGCQNPRMYGKPLQGNLSDKWRYRVGDYRILAKIQDAIVVITVVEVGHRSDVYR